MLFFVLIYLAKLSQLTCPSSETVNLKISNVIKYLMLYYERWWRRGGSLVFKVFPLYDPCNPLQTLTKLLFFSSRKEVRVGAIIVTKEGLDQVKNEISLALLASYKKK